MSLDHAILGFLAIGPKSGYDLKKRFDRSVSGFWPTDQSNIYRTLAKLRDWGHVNQEVIPQQGRPDRKVYHITADGEAELLGWLEEVIDDPQHRVGWLAQLFFAGLTRDEDAIHLLEGKAELIHRKLNAYSQHVGPSESYTHDEPERVDFYHWLPMDYAIFLNRARLEWLNDVIARIQRGESEKGRAGALRERPPLDSPVSEISTPQAPD